MPRKITDTLVFSAMNRKSNLTETMKKVSTITDSVPLEAIDDNIKLIQRRFNYDMKNRVIDDVLKGKVVLIKNLEKFNTFPKAIPAWVMVLDGKPTAVVNLSKDMRDSGGIPTIDARKLFAMMHYGSLLIGTYEKWNTLTTKTDYVRKASEIYAKLCCKVLDKLFAINLNSTYADTCQYLFAKFFMRYVLEKSRSGTIDELAYKIIANKTPKMIIQGFEEEIGGEAIYNDMKTFFSALSNLSFLSKLDLKIFLENWMIMYGETSVMALESLAYFNATIVVAMLNANVVRDFAFENVVGTKMADFYNTLSDLIKI